MVTVIVDHQRGVGLGPGLIGEQRVMAQTLPQLLGQMRHHRRREADQRFQRLAPAPAGSAAAGASSSMELASS